MWENLTVESQLGYLQRAKYLIQYNYVEEQDEENLAKTIYEKEITP